MNKEVLYMTKKEMVYQILENTKYNGVNEKRINRIINSNTKNLLNYGRHYLSVSS